MKKSRSFLLITLLVSFIFLSGCQQSQIESNSSGSSITLDDLLSQSDDLSEEESASQSDTDAGDSAKTPPQNNQQSESSQTQSKHTHNYTASVISPTCTSSGYTTFTCSCGNSYTEDETPALGHSFTGWTVTAEATTTSEGRKERTCTRCRYTEAQSIPKAIDTSSFSARVIQLVNEERSKNGLAPLQAAGDLNTFAYTRSTELPRLFAHQQPDGSDPLNSVIGFGYMAAGENIAYGFSTPESVMEAWMNSDGHRANILSTDFQYIGVGCYLENGAYYWTQTFGG